MARAETYNRDTALDAALALFWRKGYHATSLKDLEAALSMKPGSIYAAFKSKEALFKDSLARYFDQGRAKFEDHLASQTSMIDALSAHLLSFVSEARRHDPAQACMIVKTILENAEAEPHLADYARDLFDKTRAGFQHAFEAAQARGEIDAGHDAEALAKTYQANVTTLRLDNQIGADFDDSRKCAERMVAELKSL
ncbi:MAG: helix-turn-helix domain-containing protein [Pseudomonadota bacterium]